MKKCSVCGCFVKPKTDWRSILAIVSFTLLIGFIGGIFFTDWKLIPKFEQKIQKDGEIKRELQKEYLPPRPEPKKK